MLRVTILLVALHGAYQATPHVLPICLPVAPEYQSAGSNYFTARDGQDYASLNTDAIPITEVHPLTTENCENRLQELIKRQHKIQESHICGYEAGSFDGCATSAGGPLVALDRFGRNVQYGVVSYGVQDCTLENVPSVYTRVESFIDWILSNLEQ
uniref:Peptidase S1 domain-containing protein n=1 Tax=Anopheles melas TaxID=34690 RepID=A0A182TD78_9DIPT